MATSVRDARIDIVRGVAILTIVINHVTQSMQFYGLEGAPVPTPTAYGYSSAAELFVILSGYMVGLVYLSKPDPERRLLQRAGTLYLYNWLLLLCVLPFIVPMQPIEATYWRAESLLANPMSALLGFAMLVDAPRLLDILHLYIILLLAAPVAVFLYKRSATLMLGVAVAIYFLAHVNKSAQLWDGAAVWHFNPLAWQLIFFMPLVLGAQRAHVRLFSFFERPSGWKWTAALGVLVGLAAAAKVVAAHRYIPFFWLMTDRDSLGPVRIVHAALLLAFYAGLLVMAQPVIRTAPFRFLAVIGRHSLNCFAFGVFATYALTIGWARLSLGYGSYILAVALAAGMTFVAALMWDRSRSAPRRKPA